MCTYVAYSCAFSSELNCTLVALTNSFEYYNWALFPADIELLSPWYALLSQSLLRLYRYRE